MSEDLAIIEDAEIVQHSPAPMNLFEAHNPAEVIERAAEVATALNKVIQNKQLFQQIGGKPHVLVEAWTLLGNMLGVFPVIVWTHKIEGGWEARCEAKTRSGEVVGSAEAMCLRDEPNWKSRPDFALRSMAQTRARSKALSGPLGFVVTLAGYSATPAEEMPSERTQPAEATQTEAMISDAQHRKIGVLLKELETEFPTHEGQLSWVAQLREQMKVTSRKDLTKAQAGEAIEWLEKMQEAQRIPL